MSKWKIEIKAPFGGYCFDWYKDSNNIYGASNEANDMLNIDNSCMSFIRQGYSQQSLGNVSQLDTFFHGNTSRGWVVSTSNELLLLKDFDTTSESFDSKSGLPLSLGTTSVYRANTPKFDTINIDSNYFTFYTKSSGNGDIARSSGYDGTPGIDVDWGSTIPTGKAELKPTYDNNYCLSRYLGGVVFGNGNYLGKLSDSLVLTPEYIYYGNEEVVFDIESLNGYIYVLTCNDEIRDRITKSTIRLYKKELDEDTELDSFTLNGRISAMIVYNNRLYAFYKYTNSSDNWIGVLNGNIFQDIKKFDGDLPNSLQCDIYENGILFHNGTKIYHLSQKTVNGEYILTNPISPKYSTINGITSFQNKLIVGSTNGSSFDVSVYRPRTVSCYWKGITSIVSDPMYYGMIDQIEVDTNKLATGARADLSLYINQEATPSKTFTINTVGETRHVFRNIDLSNIKEFYPYISWTNGSATNLCDIRRIIIYGHTVSR